MNPLRVLLIDDNPADTDLTKETLEAGRVRLDIEVLHDGEQALARLRGDAPFEATPAPDLVLLDLNLPKVDGRTVLAEMRKLERLRRVPVVVLSSSDAERDVVKSYELGANSYVVKPVGIEAFQQIVRSVEDFWFTVVRLP